MPLERHLQSRVLARLRHIPGVAARKRWGTALGVAGDPDVYLVWKGHHIEAELKQPGEVPTPLQAARLKEWHQAGALCAVIHTTQELEELLAWLETGQPAEPIPACLWPQNHRQ